MNQGRAGGAAVPATGSGAGVGATGRGEEGRGGEAGGVPVAGVEEGGADGVGARGKGTAGATVVAGRVVPVEDAGRSAGALAGETFEPEGGALLGRVKKAGTSVGRTGAAPGAAAGRAGADPRPGRPAPVVSRPRPPGTACASRAAGVPTTELAPCVVPTSGPAATDAAISPSSHVINGPQATASGSTADAGRSNTVTPSSRDWRYTGFSGITVSSGTSQVPRFFHCAILSEGQRMPTT